MYSGACPMRRYFEGPDGGSDIHFFFFAAPLSPVLVQALEPG